MPSSQVQAPSGPSWWFRGNRPSNDNQYFQNLCRIIFQTGLNWRIVEKKWLTTKNAFCNFDIDKIASLKSKDVERLLNDSGIIRNPYKIYAIIENAKQFQQIKRRHGSFQTYLDSFDKSNNYSKVVTALAEKFERIGSTTASLFLLSVGENIRPTKMY